jgi:outer membrane protein assembly factor BamD (BamD/ComL family)
MMTRMRRRSPSTRPWIRRLAPRCLALAVLLAAPPAEAATCRASPQTIYLRAQARSEVAAARSRQAIASTQLRPRRAATPPGEHLRMYRAARADAEAAGPVALARHDLAYALALLGAREYFERRRGALYEAIYYAEDRGQRASAETFRRRQAQYEAAVQEIDREVVAVLRRVAATRHLSGRTVSEALLELGLALGRLGRDDEAAAALERVVRDHSASPSWPLAQLLRADALAKAGRAHAARQRYASLTRGEPGILRALANFRLAHALLVDGPLPGPPKVEANPEASLQAFIAAIRETRTHDPEAPLARQLRRDARRDLPLAYAAARGPERALATMQTWGTDAARGEDMTARMGQQLAEFYLARDQPAAAASVYRQLVATFPAAPEACRWRARIVVTTFATDDVDAQRAALQELVSTAQRIADSDARASVRKGCRYAAAELLAAAARDWHRRGEVDDDATLRQRAAAAYRIYAESFADLGGSEAVARDRDALTRGELPEGPLLMTCSD